MALTLAFNSCDPTPQQGGRIEQTPNLEYNSRVISPIIIVPPLLTCGTSVTVRGFVPGARLRIYSGTSVIGDAIGLNPDGQTISVTSPLASPQVITATQEFEATESGPSSPVTVQDHTAVYPTGLPRPTLPFLYLYNCGVATAIGELPPGGSVRVFSRDASAAVPGSIVGQANGVAATQSLWINPPFQTSKIITAESQICTDVSTLSEEQVVQPAPTSLPTPEVTALYDGGTIVTVHKLVNGTKVSISKAGTSIGGGGAPGSHVAFGLSPAVSGGDVLNIVQELCGVNSPTGTVTVQPCSALPPARLLAPRAGDEIVYLTDVVEGSRIRIFSAGQEIADGGGTSLHLIRPLVQNETLIVVQSLGSCISQSVYVVEVGHGLDDPIAVGPCGQARSFEYGHAGDPARQTTDVSSYFNSPDASVSVSMNAVPLHGIVRYPSGPGPFPIVLIVHGNHSPLDPSYPGYTYLLDHFASHCMIAVSIEEDFLNGFVGGEMDARGIVLLRHLQLWREWNRTPGNEFYGKVDLGSVGLAGHSRGGEAIVAAELFNSTLHNAADPAHNFNFGIKGLYAIAPVDGQFDNGPITLSGADYYVMHGSHDGDVSDFGGHRLYDRAFPVNNSTNNFKGLLYIYGANHGNWNTGWGTCCESAITPTASAISGNDQMTIGKSYMTSFYLASLKGWNSYRYFLNGEVTFTSLPPAVTRVFQYQDPKKLFLNHFEEDDDVTTGSQPGVVNIHSSDFDQYVDYTFNDEGPPNFLWGQTDGVIAAWQKTERADVRIRIPGEIRARLSEYEFLAFQFGQTFERPATLNTAGTHKELGVQAMIGTTGGPVVVTSSYAAAVYPMDNSANARGVGGPKSVMQTIRIPLRDLVTTPADIASISEIILKFNRHPSGIVAIDEIQFTK
jgi:hypothetical protein